MLFLIIAFPTDIIIGPAKQVYTKLKMSSIFKFILFLLYVYVGLKIKHLMKSKLAAIFWPIGILGYIYDQTVLEIFS